MNIKEVKNMINKEWKTSCWMEINGFLFFTDEFNISISDLNLFIFTKETGRLVTMILWKKINSLVIDEEVIL